MVSPSPEPVPSRSSRVNSPNTDSRYSFGTPGPWSSTRTCTRPSASDEDGQVDPGVGRCEAQGVLEHHDEDELEHIGVDRGDHQLVARDHHLDVPFTGQVLQSARGAHPRARSSSTVSTVGLECAGVDARHLQHLGDEPIEAVGLGAGVQQERASVVERHGRERRGAQRSKP